MLWLGHRINPTLVERVAAGYPLDAQPKPTQDTMALYRLLGISRTRRIVAAIIAEEGADQVTVSLDQHENQFFHNGH